MLAGYCRALCHPGVSTCLLAFVLTGCGWFNDDRGVFVDPRDDYLDAKPGRAIAVPADMAADRLGDPTPIPPTPTQDNANYYPHRPPLPDAIYGDEKSEEVRIQRIGERRWLVVPEEATTIWPKLKQFFAENGVRLADERTNHGRLDTEWLTLGVERPRDLVRLTLLESREEAGSAQRRDERGTGNAACGTRHSRRHKRDSPAASDSDQGNARAIVRRFRICVPARVGAEQRLLAEIGAYIAAKVAEQTISMVATRIPTQAKSLMERNDSGAPALRLNLDLERAWATVGQALSNAEVEVLDVDSDARRYHIKVTEQTFSGEDERGFFGRMFSFGDGRGQEYRLLLEPVAQRRRQRVLADRARCRRSATGTRGGATIARTRARVRRLSEIADRQRWDQQSLTELSLSAPCGLASLGSGSRGNGTLVALAQRLFLVDCGFPVRTTEARLLQLGVRPAQINAIFVSHEHSDHASGVAAFAHKYALPVYASQGTRAALKGGLHAHVLYPGESVHIGDVEVVPITVPHDAREPTQFVFNGAGYRLGVLSDLGHITPHVIEAYGGLNALLVEANHDRRMLQQGRYPASVKRRVGGDHGHLSNEQTARLLTHIAHPGLHVIIGHVSEENNAEALLHGVLEPLRPELGSLQYATQQDGHGWIAPGEDPPAAQHSPQTV